MYKHVSYRRFGLYNSNSSSILFSCYRFPFQMVFYAKIATVKINNHILYICCPKVPFDFIWTKWKIQWMRVLWRDTVHFWIATTESIAIDLLSTFFHNILPDMVTYHTVLELTSWQPTGVLFYGVIKKKGIDKFAEGAKCMRFDTFSRTHTHT